MSCRPAGISSTGWQEPAAAPAFTAPAALSILTTSFREGHRRNRALGIYAAAAASGFIFGLVAGGLLTRLSWRHTFAVVVPVALLLLLATLRVVRPDLEATDGRRGRLDVGGALSVTGASLVFVRAIVEAPTAGWASLQTIGSFLLTALLLTVFVAIERSVEQPLVRLGILRSAVLVRANAGAVLLFGCATGLNFITTLYLQDLLGWGPLKTGLFFMFSGLTTAAVGPRAGALMDRARFPDSGVRNSRDRSFILSRWRSTSHACAEIEARQSDTIEAEPLEQAA